MAFILIEIVVVIVEKIETKGSSSRRGTQSMDVVERRWVGTDVRKESREKPLQQKQVLSVFISLKLTPTQVPQIPVMSHRLFKIRRPYSSTTRS